MKRINNMLNQNETIIAEIKPYLPKLIICSKSTGLSTIALIISIAMIHFTDITKLILLIPLIMAFIGYLPILIKYWFTTYIITTEKVIIETGITRDYDIVKLSRISDTSMDTNVVDYIFSTGCIHLSTANEFETKLIPNVKNPKKVLKMLKF